MPADTPLAAGASLERRHYVFVGLMLGVFLVVDVGSRMATAADLLTSAQREGIGLVNFVPLAMAMLALQRVIQEARLVKFCATAAIAMLAIAQFFDFRTAVLLPTGNTFFSAPFSAADEIFFGMGSVTLLGSCLFGLLQLESDRISLRRKHLDLDLESAQRAQAQEELQCAHQELERRVEERTAELAEKNQQLAVQLQEGERIRAQLERNRYLLREMERITQCGAWEIRAGSEVINATEECRRILGLQPGEVFTTADVLEIIPSDMHAMLARLRREAWKDGLPWHVETPFIRRSGERRWLRSEGRPERGPDGALVSIIGTVQDITELRAAEAALRESENLLHAVISAAPLVLWVLDTEGRVTLNTGMGLARMGFTLATHLGKNLFEMYPPESTVARLARRALQGQSCSDILELNGFVLQASYSPLYDGQGQMVGAIGVALDVTQERLYESRVRQQQKMEAIGALAGGIAHDFNNILYAMDGFAALAAKMVKDNAQAAECIAELRSAAARARELVDRILTFSRKEITRRELVDMVRVVRDTARLMEPSLPRDIYLHLELDARTPQVEADPGQMQQVLMNLCTNARDAMRNGGGELHIVLGPRELSKEEAASAGLEAGCHAECVVSDTGSGMETYIASRLFEPFFTTKPVGEGTGLGLAIVHNIVHAHGGVISVDSAPGVGTRVRVLLPGVGAAEGEVTTVSTAGPAAIDPAVAGPPRRVGVVDDEPQVRIFLRMLLEDAGHKVTCYRTGEEALAGLLAMDPPPEVVLADLIMPGMSGLELWQELRHKYPDLPFVLCSGHVEAALSPEVRAADVAAFVKKPIDPEALLALLARVTATNRKEVHS